MGIFSFFDKEEEQVTETQQQRDTTSATTETTSQTRNTTEELNRLLESQQAGEKTETQLSTSLTKLFSDEDLGNLRGLTDLLSGSVDEGNLLPGAGAGAALESIDIASLIGDQAADIPSLIQSLTEASADKARREFDLTQKAQISKTASNLGGNLSNSFVQQLFGLGAAELESSLAEQAARFGLEGERLGLQFSVAGAETLRGGAQTASDVRQADVNNLLQSLGVLRGAEATQETDLSSLIKSLTTGEETTKQSSEQNVLADLIRNLTSTSTERASGTGKTTSVTSDPIGQLTNLISAVGSLIPAH